MTATHQTKPSNGDNNLSPEAGTSKDEQGDKIPVEVESAGVADKLVDSEVTATHQTMPSNGVDDLSPEAGESKDEQVDNIRLAVQGCG